MKRTIVKSFDEDVVNSSVLYALESAAFSCLGVTKKQPFFFLEIRRRNFIEQFEMLGDYEGESAGAPLVTCVFFDPNVVMAEYDASLAMSAFINKAQECGLMIKPVPFRKLFNDVRHGELKEVCSVPKEYVCYASFAVGKAKEVEEIEIDSSFQLAAYVQ